MVFALVAITCGTGADMMGEIMDSGVPDTGVAWCCSTDKQNSGPRSDPKAAVLVWQWGYCGGCTSTDRTPHIVPPHGPSELREQRSIYST